ncbi:MAG: hypothetical protein OER90_04425 [Gemmatimonadota bacterium]|nr:hypothetical protein [Gemmatimonadota bacterium]
MDTTDKPDVGLDELLDCNDRAVGGASLRAARSVEYELDIVESTFSVRGTYTADREGTAHIDIFAAGERVFSEGWNGSTGWQLPQGARDTIPTSDAGAAALRHGLEQPGHLWTMKDMVRNGHSVELVDDAVQGPASTRLVKLTLKDGFESWYRIDSSSCQVVSKRNFRAFHPDVDPEERWIESRFADFRSDGEITRAWTTFDVDLVTGDTVGTTRIISVHTTPDA